jgi:hypothetical protein
MKKLILTVLALSLLVLLPSLGFSQTWHPTNQATIAWDTVVLPAGAPGSIAYDVYTVGATADKSTAAKVTRATTNQIVIGFAVEGKYFVGVRSVRVVNGEDVAFSESTSWSDNPLVVAAGTFGVVYYVPPANVSGIRREQ